MQGYRDLASRIFVYLEHRWGQVVSKEWSVVALKILPSDLFQGFLLNIGLTYLCKKHTLQYVTSDALPIAFFYAIPQRVGVNLKVISQHSWVGWTSKLEVPFS